MIRQIWIRIIALLALAVIPVIILQFRLQEDSISLVFDLADKTEVRDAMDDILSYLRTEAQKNPEREQDYKSKFLDVSETKKSLESFFMAKDSIYKNIRYQTLVLSLAVLVLSLLGSLMISRGIVNRAQALMKEQERAAQKLRDLNALQNWQNVAKTLVHELRAPMTPIKLIASDLAFKKRTLSPEAFEHYLKDAQDLMNEQIEAIETMIEGFTLFGKLPSPQFQNVSLYRLLNGFLETYRKAFGSGVQIQLELNAKDRDLPLDSKLIRDLLFNLCKNASEANDGLTSIRIIYQRNETSDQIIVRNSGREIPNSVKNVLFDPYVSTKGGANLGLGLAISRKIAFDHKGDLSLLEGNQGVSFLIDLPFSPNRGRK